MVSAALRPIALALLVAGAAAAAPSPPGSIVRFNGYDYVSMIDVSSRLGLHFGFSTDGAVMTLNSAGHRAVLSGRHPDEREMGLDGVRIYMGDPAVARGGHFYISRTDFEHRLLPLLRPDLAGPVPRRPRIVVLDPGHGGIDPGTENRRYHLQEKTLTLDVALRLRTLLQREGWIVASTRTRDSQFSVNKAADLEMRANFAAREHADIFLSIHFDAAPSSSLSGSEIMTYNPVGQRSTDSWGMGRGDRRREFEPGNRNDNWNVVLAHCLFRNLPRRLGTSDHGERIKDLSVLRNASCPAVLVEPAFISNDSEARRVANPAFREQMAEALAAGLQNYAALIGSLQPRLPPRGK